LLSIYRQSGKDKLENTQHIQGEDASWTDPNKGKTGTAAKRKGGGREDSPPVERRWQMLEFLVGWLCAKTLGSVKLAPRPRDGQTRYKLPPNTTGFEVTLLCDCEDEECECRRRWKSAWSTYRKQGYIKDY
jgi:hypothetical protein